MPEHISAPSRKETPPQESSLTERRLSAVDAASEPLARIVRALPGGERVTADAILKEGKELAIRVQQLRAQAVERARVSFRVFMRRRDNRIGAVMLGCMTATAGLGSWTKPGKLLTERATLHDIADWEERPAAEDLPSYEEMISELSQAIGSDALRDEIPVRAGDYVDAIREYRRERARMQHPLHIEVGSTVGLPAGRFAEILRASLPATWTGERAVEAVTVSPDPMPLPKEYGIEGYADGVCEGGRGGESSLIRLAPHYAARPVAFSLLDHEMAHANDWHRSNVMSAQDRLTLLYRVHARVSSENRIRFSYVESIKNEDPKRQHLLKVNEYWAELIRLAMQMPPSGHEEQWKYSMMITAWRMNKEDMSGFGAKDSIPGEEDMRLLRWYFSVSDPDFKPWKAARERSVSVDRTMYQAVEKNIGLSLNRLPSGNIRALALAKLERSLEEEKAEKTSRIVVRAGKHGLRRSRELTAAQSWESPSTLLARMPDSSQTIVASCNSLFHTLDEWRSRRNGATFVSLFDPRMDVHAIEIAKQADSLSKVLANLPEADRRQAEHDVVAYFRSNDNPPSLSDALKEKGLTALLAMHKKD